MSKKEANDELVIHRWEAEDIQDALRELNNYLHFSQCKTCSHRNLTGAMNTINNVLNGKPNTPANRLKIDTDYKREE